MASKIPEIGGILTGILFLGLHSLLLSSSTVSGQWETPNNLCGGLFRSTDGVINFTYNEATNPDAGMKKVCMWTIIAEPVRGSYEVTIESSSLTCNSTNDQLGLTGFNENNSDLATRTSFCTAGQTQKITGSVLVVTLVSQSSTNGRGFVLRWHGEDFYTRYRFITLYNSYGMASNTPPYYAAGFMGNSLATFGFPMGNRTAGYTMEMVFSRIELLGWMDEDDYNCPGRTPEYCNSLTVCRVLTDGTLVTAKRYDSRNNVTEEAPEALKSEYGLFLIMWGGNYYSTSGGGRMVMTYNSVRN